MKKTLAAIALLVTAGLTLTACGEDPDGDATSSTSSDSPGAFNDADVTFAQQMIPHHEQAIEMAQMAQGRANSDEVLDARRGHRGRSRPRDRHPARVARGVG